MICLTTNRIIIRDPLLTDIDAWHRLICDPKTMYYLPDIMTRSLEESRNNLETAVAEAHNPNRTKYYFVIEDKKTGAFIGTAGYTVTRTVPVGKAADVGYFILPEYHGQGIMTEALLEVIRFAFEDDGVYRIETGCLTENRASERIMQKCGFIKEAERKSYAWHDGRLKDRVEYRLLRDEWVDTIKTRNNTDTICRSAVQADIDLIIARFAKQGDNKPREVWDTYLCEQKNGERIVINAKINGEIAGYVTLFPKAKDAV